MKCYIVTDILGRTFNVRMNDLNVPGSLGNGGYWSKPDGVLKAQIAYFNFLIDETGVRINTAHIVIIAPWASLFRKRNV